MSSIWLWTSRPSLIFTEQHCFITTSSNPSNSSQILVQPLLYRPIIGILAPLLRLHPWCWRTLLPSECLVTGGQPISECAKLQRNMRKTHYWLFVSALWLLHVQSKPLLFQRELKHGGLATFSVVACFSFRFRSVFRAAMSFKCLSKHFFRWLPRFWSSAKVFSSAQLTNCSCSHPWQVKRGFGLKWNMAASHVSWQNV